jgi:hypothetical protein
MLWDPWQDLDRGRAVPGATWWMPLMNDAPFNADPGEYSLAIETPPLRAISGRPEFAIETADGKAVPSQVPTQPWHVQTRDFERQEVLRFKIPATANYRVKVTGLSNGADAQMFLRRANTSQSFEMLRERSVVGLFLLVMSVAVLFAKRPNL